MNFMNHRSIILGLSGLACIAFFRMAQAVVPAPDGGYLGGNTAEGQAALFSLTTGVYNTAVGFFSLRTNTGGQFNTAVGAGALLSNNNGTNDSTDGVVSSSQNTAIGAGALLSNTGGGHNTAMGAFALFNNTTFGFSTATGSNALVANTTGPRNTANGAFALAGNTTSESNTASGGFALFSNTEGDFNTAIGDSALYSNTTGGVNTADGFLALTSNTTGGFNTASGYSALTNNISGSTNTAIGRAALGANTAGNGNIAIGGGAGTNIRTGSGNIDIGNGGMADESDTIRIGDAFNVACFIRGIHDAVVPGTGVVVSLSGQLGVRPSSAGFKGDIKPMDRASEAILALKPVTFSYKKEIDPAGAAQFGLVAEDVEALNPDLVVRDKEGKPYSVRYDQINAMLLNEFLKEHRKVEKLQVTVLRERESFQSKLTEQEREIQALTLGLQKVSAQLEMSDAVPQLVLNSCSDEND
jgi:trimeric autotransporter adhesin